MVVCRILFGVVVADVRVFNQVYVFYLKEINFPEDYIWQISRGFPKIRQN